MLRQAGGRVLRRRNRSRQMTRLYGVAKSLATSFSRATSALTTLSEVPSITCRLSRLLTGRLSGDLAALSNGTPGGMHAYPQTARKRKSPRAIARRASSSGRSATSESAWRATSGEWAGRPSDGGVPSAPAAAPRSARRQLVNTRSKIARCRRVIGRMLESTEEEVVSMAEDRARAALRHVVVTSMPGCLKCRSLVRGEIRLGIRTTQRPE